MGEGGSAFELARQNKKKKGPFRLRCGTMAPQHK